MTSAMSLSAFRSTLHRAMSTSASPVSSPPWLPGLRRTGAIARKLGMDAMWDSHGLRIPVTVLHLQDTQVVGHKTHGTDSYRAVQIGCANRMSRNHIPYAQKQWYAQRGLPPKHIVAEFQVDRDDALVPIGTEVSAAHFVVGQYVDVKAVSKGKGFAGVMKRWGFKGGNASHGATKHHRKAGSTGQHQDPGRVFPGKKMAGRMGHVPTITRSLLVTQIDTIRNLVYLKGCVPGPTQTFVKLWDAEKKMNIRESQKWQKQVFTEGDLNANTILPGGIKSVPYPVLSLQQANMLPPIVTIANSS